MGCQGEKLSVISSDKVCESDKICPSIYNLPGGRTLPVGLVQRLLSVSPGVEVLGEVGVDGLG